MNSSEEDGVATDFALTRIKVRHMQLILALNSTGNLRKAAELLNLTQPGATRILQELEGALQVQLYERSHQGLSPTVFGLEVTRRVRAVMSDIAGIQNTVDALRVGQAGDLRIGTIASIAPIILSRAIASVKQLSPTLKIQIREGDNYSLLGELQAGALDVVLGRVDVQANNKELWREFIYREQFSVVCDVSHPLAKSSRRFLLPELLAWPWILPLENAPLRHALETQFALSAQKQPIDAIESASVMTNLAILREIPALAVMTRSVANYFFERHLLKIIPCDLDLGFGGGVAYFRRQSDAINGPTAKLLHCMRTVAAS
jgi:DNA-binding transcriptional LysR family regulator